MLRQGNQRDNTTQDIPHTMNKGMHRPPRNPVVRDMIKIPKRSQGAHGSSKYTLPRNQKHKQGLQGAQRIPEDFVEKI